MNVMRMRLEDRRRRKVLEKITGKCDPNLKIYSKKNGISFNP